MTMQGKADVITGAGSGIGAACAREFAGRGVSVVLADINGAAATARADEITRSGGRARGFQVDVADEAGVRAMIAEAITHYGRLDILHNNAAATFESQLDDDLTTTDASVWDLTFAVNLRGAMLG